jgi:AcrR family transcriptional regulator
MLFRSVDDNTESYSVSQDPSTTRSTMPDKPPRRDVQRNLAALLESAKAVFGELGVDAPAKDVTDRAGVGVGTLYRHFPKRSDLIVAVLRNELDECVSLADELAGSAADPIDALRRWIDRFLELVATKQGLADALHSSDPAYEGLPGAIISGLEPALDRLLDRGQAAGSVREDVTARELLVAVAMIAHEIPGDDWPSTRRLVALILGGVLIDGDRPDTRSSRPATLNPPRTAA